MPSNSNLDFLLNFFKKLGLENRSNFRFEKNKDVAIVHSFFPDF